MLCCKEPEAPRAYVQSYPPALCCSAVGYVSALWASSLRAQQRDDSELVFRPFLADHFIYANLSLFRREDGSAERATKYQNGLPKHDTARDTRFVQLLVPTTRTRACQKNNPVRGTCGRFLSSVTRREDKATAGHALSVWLVTCCVVLLAGGSTWILTRDEATTACAYHDIKFIDSRIEEDDT